MTSGWAIFGWVFLWAISALFFVTGLLAYTGRFRTWATRGRSRPYAIVFGGLFGALATPIASVGLVLGGDAVVPAALLAGVCLLLFGLSYVWFPPLLLPRWFRARKGIS